LDPDNPLGDLFDLDPEESVVITIANWVESRAMMTTDGKIKFRQHRESGNEDWVITDFIQPMEDEWYNVTSNARALRLETPMIAWSGPVNQIPDGLLLSEAPLMVRCVDSPGWFSLRLVAQASCEAEA
jgi:hypothetical protein